MADFSQPRKRTFRVNRPIPRTLSTRPAPEVCRGEVGKRKAPDRSGAFRRPVLFSSELRVVVNREARVLTLRCADDVRVGAGEGRQPGESASRTSVEWRIVS